MSFGRPPSLGNVGFKVTPPDRGSFPLDHYAECKNQMMVYMNCLRENSNTSTACRDLSKQYLDCRMQKGLMDKDEWRNLGLANVDKSGGATDSVTNLGVGK
ncbi:Cytochrome c oxidase assembly protein cox19 [Stygiomarasmius scandens]|uniref:Cytochrome c oxidase assembly protein COX19 n=1 Tax=Marasmiellus scandens TaxID=2682957 RepID=A0ABR1JX69_9AGAR